MNPSNSPAPSRPSGALPRAALALGLALFATGFALAVPGCGARNSKGGGGGGGGGGGCVAGEKRCVAGALSVCVGGTLVEQEKCPAACDTALGCVACIPGGKFCEGDTIRKCDDNGNPAEVVTTCAGGACVSGQCVDPCGRAASEFSYIGCDYFPTVTANAEVLDEAHFAVAVANPNSEPATVKITRPGKPDIEQQVPGGGLKTIQLDWVPELKNAKGSILLKGGAYKLNASLPVTVYQFNPLEYEAKGCGQLDCFTFTNDASLLLPSHTLTQNYIAIARPTFMFRTKDFFSTEYNGKYSGYISIVGVEDAQTTVRVRFTAPAMVVGGGGGNYARGQEQQFTLGRQDVLQIFSAVPGQCTPQFTEKDGQTEIGYCDLPNYDLTGTEVLADRKVAVFSGHNCTFVPYNRWACDHLEEQMFPLESWGKKYAVAKVERKPPTIPDLIRVVSGADNNQIQFTPSVSAPVTLNRGQWIEFPTTQDFVVEGTEALGVAQFMVGQDYNGMQSGGDNPGDPAMMLSVPVEQYRTSYIFLAPESYVLNYVNVTAPSGETVMLDGAAIDPAKFKPIQGTEYMAARLAIKAGTHKIESAKEFGIATYGLAPYTSYMYPGGLDVKQINIQ